MGAEPVDFPDKIECCGAHLSMWRADVAEKLSRSVIASACERGAEAIVTSCPLCQYNLEKGGSSVPVVYFTQILGLALGQAEETLGFEKNLFDIRPLLKEKGV
jgi:heterodisulfide reductase subunit B